MAKNEYDPNRDQRDSISYGRWGKASEMGGEAEERSPRLSQEQIQAYREHMAKEAEEFTFRSDRPNIRKPEENFDTPNHGVQPRTPTIYEQREFSVNVPEHSQRILENGYAEHEAIHQRSMSIPTDIKVNRREIDMPTTKIGHSDIFRVPDTNPILIMQVCNDLFGEDWMDWEPETITQTFEAEGIDVHAVNLNKMFAIRTVVKTDRFENEAFIFEKVVTAFSNRVVDWTTIQQPRVFDIASTVALIDRFIKALRFSDEIAAYSAACAITDGYVILPPELSYCDASFAVELAMTIGDEILDMQENLMNLMKMDGEDIPEDYQPQYMRLLRCQYHVKGKIDEVR